MKGLYVSKSKSALLQEQSLSMALAAIEIYNKPNFPSRDLIFPILMVDAWESLAKAKLLIGHSNKLTCLYTKEFKKNTYKKNRSGGYQTIGVMCALTKCAAPKVLLKNVGHLVVLRDEATHLPKQSKAHPLLIFNLGAASLKSYAILLQEWFNVSVNKYDLFILPLGFSYPFTTMTAVELKREPDFIARIVRAVTADQDLKLDEGGHNLVCEIQAKLISAKKISGDPDITAVIGQDGEAAFVTNKSELNDRYPFNWGEAHTAVRNLAPHVNQPMFTKFIKDNDIKGDERYSAYSYTTRSNEQKGPTKSTTVIYNYDFVRICASVLNKEQVERPKPEMTPTTRSGSKSSQSIEDSITIPIAGQTLSGL